MELSGNTTIHVPFIDNELPHHEKRNKERVTDHQEELKQIFKRINDIISLDPFSKERFDNSIEKAEKERKETIEAVEKLDYNLKSEYILSEGEEQYAVKLFQQLIEASRQGNTISPIHFDLDAYKESEIYKFRPQAEQKTIEYIKNKVRQEEIRTYIDGIETKKNLVSEIDDLNPFEKTYNSYLDGSKETIKIDLENDDLFKNTTVKINQEQVFSDEQLNRIREFMANPENLKYTNHQNLDKIGRTLDFYNYQRVLGNPNSELAGNMLQGGAVATSAFNFMFEDVGTIISEDASLGERALSSFFLVNKYGKLLDRMNDTAGGVGKVKDVSDVKGGIDNSKLSPSNYPNPDPPMFIPPVRYEPKTIEEVIRMRQGKGPTTKMMHGDKNIEAHHRQQVPVKNGGILDELEQKTHRGGGNHTRHDKPSQLTPSQRAKEIREHYKERGKEYLLPGEGI